MVEMYDNDVAKCCWCGPMVREENIYIYGKESQAWKKDFCSIYVSSILQYGE